MTRCKIFDYQCDNSDLCLGICLSPAFSCVRPHLEVAQQVLRVALACRCGADGNSNAAGVALHRRCVLREGRPCAAAWAWRLASRTLWRTPCARPRWSPELCSPASAGWGCAHGGRRGRCTRLDKHASWRKRALRGPRAPRHEQDPRAKAGTVAPTRLYIPAQATDPTRARHLPAGSAWTLSRCARIARNRRGKGRQAAMHSPRHARSPGRHPTLEAAPHTAGTPPNAAGPTGRWPPPTADNARRPPITGEMFFPRDTAVLCCVSHAVLELLSV